MEFTIHPRHNKVLENYNAKDLVIARQFTEKIYKELGNMLKAVILFGSASHNQKKSKNSDIDILCILDDVSIMLGKEMIQTYRIIVEKAVVDISTKLHITSLRLSTFWEYARAGDPVAINMLRDGVALIDTGFFNPLQLLLREGRIRPSQEAVWAYFIRAPNTLHNSKWHIVQATLDLYWACIDSAHSVLMSMGAIPPSPDHVADLLDLKLVKTKKLNKKYSKTMRKFYDLSKMITHHEIKEIKGDEYSKYLAEAEEFVDEMRKLVEKQHEHK